ncbi:ribonuclease h1 large subunit, putative [Theileria annulata]|uniref:Ribonuclease n=1 Tax=Theileria annulata TaxID=5874 RepID=Q4UG04_THEAN|nr:ribonuclease h1 large subunit, putative [Theileria annulata]CAI73985.1 ribonuclease h1 large subunit, putative [Theileria annulata]|eukprot:XP_954665.1 ribonuclease h1 large subunit, putative [Theileria annulata]
MEGENHLKCFRLHRFGNISKSDYVILGIDEAGRGPVLGPMVYGGFFCTKGDNCNSILKNKIKVDDSKKLSESMRENKFYQLNDPDHPFGVVAEVITPQYISYKMLQREKYNLNEISHDTAISIIRHVLSHGYNLKEVYIDAVGTVNKYESKLSKMFPKIQFSVREKADSIYPTVSAASIVAKVIRDNIIKTWKFDFEVENIGSGYPGDPYTKDFLTKNMDKIFGFPDIVRFSWSTASNLLNGSESVEVDWYDEENFPSKKSDLPAPLCYTIKNVTKL